jgi:hypothetical protein
MGRLPNEKSLLFSNDGDDYFVLEGVKEVWVFLPNNITMVKKNWKLQITKSILSFQGILPCNMKRKTCKKKYSHCMKIC